jgi:2-hydroxychromene-2-carboxylate isomerase
MQTLGIFFDPLSAPSWLALRPTLNLLERLHLNADWQPFTAPHPRRLAPQVDESVSQRHQRVRQAYRDRDQERYAAWQGIPLQTPIAAVDRPLLDYSLLLANDNGIAASFLTHVGDHYWGGKSAPIDVGWLSRALRVDDLQENFLAEGEMRLAAARAQVDELGIFDAPVYLVSGELYVGRQHLPAIERIMSGINPFEAAGIRR